MINEKTLQCSIEVDRLLSFRGAAKAIGISQPSLSDRIRNLEDYVGFIIFDRTNPKQIITTEKGKAFIKQAKVVMNEIEKLKGA